VSGGTQVRGNRLLQAEPGMVGAKGDSHRLSQACVS